VALAFAVGTASFALTAVVLAAADSGVVAVLLGVACIAAVIWVARSVGIAYAVSMAMAVLLAYDWYEVPPVHSNEFPHAGPLADLLAYLAVSVLVGELAAYSGRRADVTEVARSELADEQAALRRVATLVASDVPQSDVFAAVAREVGQLLNVDATHLARYEPDETAIAVAAWSRHGAHIPTGTRAPVEGDSVTARVARSRRPERTNSYDNAAGSGAAVGRDMGLRSTVGAPVTVDGRLWGVMLASSKSDLPLPADTEPRVAAFTELIATALSNTEARGEVKRLAEEQAALRRVATLVAQGVPPKDVFRAVTEEIGTLLGADLAGMIRYETDATVTPVAIWAAGGEHAAVPDRWATEEGDAPTMIATTLRAVRIDDWNGVPGAMAAFIRDVGIVCSIGSPIVVDGHLWGALAVHSRQSQPFPADAESRLENFTDLLATAIANAGARAEVQRLADEQSALRRVATLVAREAPPAEIFAAVTEELEQLLPAEDLSVVRYGGDATVTILAYAGASKLGIPVGTPLPLAGENIAGMMLRTGRPARIDDFSKATGPIADRARAVGRRSAVGSPIVVDGRVWGAMVATSNREEALPANTESRIGEFTELVAMAISNVQVRSDLAASRTRIVAATDDERRRVVRDLHDGAQQRLVHTIITLRMALKNEGAAARALAAEALTEAESAQVELRELAHGILPSVLTRGGLRAGVESLASRMQVPVEVDVSVDRLPAPVEATAYFVVAEALTNVAKHSQAERAAVNARVDDGTLRLDVRDDGVGGARPDGDGLVGLGDRLAALDGEFRIESPPDGGTLIAAVIPLDGSGPEDGELGPDWDPETQRPPR
jgi:signal transduction histidine kinase